MVIRAASPLDMTEQERDEFTAFVGDAGEVSLATLPGLVEQAASLITAYVDGKLIGTAAIKRPHPGHRRDEFAKAGAMPHADSFPLELGWVVVHPDHRQRGLGRAMVAAAVSAAPREGLYATTKTEGMKRILARLGFEKLGSEYPSALNTHVPVTLFVRR